MGKTKVECKKLEVLTGAQKCVFCQRTEIDEIKYGPIYMHRNIITHYYCLLLSSNMEQNGRDSDGILGFLPSDIQKEVKRGVRLHCSFCRGGGATLGCAIAKCKVVFHLPCGMNHGTLHQFFGEFKSFCAKHRPVQRIGEKILAESSKNAMCGICYEKVVPRPIHETLWAPCCQKNAFFHRDCVQKLATSAGYFFKCPLCNNTTTFQKEMKEYGIYIPEQDASWECVPNAYQDLLVRHDTCDSSTCSCPSGRKTNNQGTRWELILCKFCGSQGIHIGCGRLKWRSPEWVCKTCAGENERIAQEANARNYEGNRHRLSGTGRAAEIHPSVSADREGEMSENDSSDDSLKVTVTNRGGRKKLVSPPARVVTPPPSSKRSSSAIAISHTRTAPSSTVVIEDPTVKEERAIIIDDSDSDIEVVGETNSSCLKTNDGATIPVVKMKDSVKKRLNVEGDVNIVPDEIVDITIQMHGPPKKKAPSPHVEEVVYSLPMSKPSTSSFNVPSTSFAPPPDMTKFVLVDPSSFRPEDLPPGTVLYRSVQPMVTVPQTTAIPPQQPMPTGQVPMPQLGGSGGCDADAQHSDLSQHWRRSSDNLHTSACHLKKTSRKAKCDCGGRRRRRDHPDRLNPKVLMSPLKCRISSQSFVEILVPRRNLCFGLGPIKRKAAPLPARPAKKIKLSSTLSDGRGRKETKTRVNKTSEKNRAKNKVHFEAILESCSTTGEIEENASSTVEKKTNKKDRKLVGDILQVCGIEEKNNGSSTSGRKSKKKDRNSLKLYDIIEKENTSSTAEIKKKTDTNSAGNSLKLCDIVEKENASATAEMKKKKDSNSADNSLKLCNIVEKENTSSIAERKKNKKDSKSVGNTLHICDIVQTENTSPKESTSAERKKKRKKSFTSTDWKFKKIDEYMNKPCNKSQIQSNQIDVKTGLSDLDEKTNIKVKFIIDEVLESVLNNCELEEHANATRKTSEESSVTDFSCVENKHSIIELGALLKKNQAFGRSCTENTRCDVPVKKVASVSSTYGNADVEAGESPVTEVTRNNCPSQDTELLRTLLAKSPSCGLRNVVQRTNSNRNKYAMKINGLFPKIKVKTSKIKASSKNEYKLFRKPQEISNENHINVQARNLKSREVKFALKARKRKFEQVSFASKKSTIERYLTPIKKDNICSPIKKLENMTYCDRMSEKAVDADPFALAPEHECSGNNGSDNQGWKSPLSVKSPEKVSNTPFQTPESVKLRLWESPTKRPLMELQLNKSML